MSAWPVYIHAHDVVTPLASGTAANVDAMAAGKTGVQATRHQVFQNQGIYGALFSETQWNDLTAPYGAGWSKFEVLLLHSINAVMAATENVRLNNRDTVLIIASTKGNIGDLKEGSVTAAEHAGLHHSAIKIARELGYHSRPVVVSNACISGLTALLVAKRFIQRGQYKNAVVVGADCISPFIMAGFRSFQALSDAECQPFDQDRKGLNLGEGAGAIILSRSPADLTLSGGATTNDANHISGPSRTGAEMAHAIQSAIRQADIDPTEIGFIAAHGTATPYNDEMESKAFILASLDKAPAFSLKAMLGHTLGAAGIIESAIALEAFQRGWILPSRGYTNHGVTSPVKISRQLTKDQLLHHFIKTGSGFGGCNAALVFSKTTF